ncbi:hypothetical protein R6Q57_015026 [Mikania cordata]
MNPKSNNLDFNLLNDPEAIRRFLFQMQQNPNPQWPQPNSQTKFSSFTQPGFQSRFPSFTQPGFQQAFSQPHHELDFMTTDVVLNTQESQKKKKKGKRVKETDVTGPSGGPMAPKPWIYDEKTTLGRCNIDYSENKTKVHSPGLPSTRAVRVDSIANRRPSATTRPSAVDD